MVKEVNINLVNRAEVNMVRFAPYKVRPGRPIDPEEYFMLDVSKLDFAKLK